MTFGAQQEVLRLIPGLERARFVRLGMIHRNTFVCAPRHLDARLRVKVRPELRLAGQLTGVEGYVESAAVGLLAGLFLAAELAGVETPPPPGWTAHGGLIRHLTERPPHRFQPANAAWGLMLDPPIALPRDKAARRQAAASYALDEIRRWRAVAAVAFARPPARLSVRFRVRAKSAKSSRPTPQRAAPTYLRRTAVWLTRLVRELDDLDSRRSTVRSRAADSRRLSAGEL